MTCKFEELIMQSSSEVGVVDGGGVFLRSKVQSLGKVKQFATKWHDYANGQIHSRTKWSLMLWNFRSFYNSL